MKTQKLTVGIGMVAVVLASGIGMTLGINEAQARPPYYAALLHALPPGNKVAQSTQCRTCHDGSHLNYFGQDFAKIVLHAADKKTAFVTLFGRDSDGDGRSNLQEMMEGTNPGVKDAPPAGFWR